MKKVQMFTVLGEQEINVGTCHPGQARILVKMEFASWQDGRLRLVSDRIHKKAVNGSWYHPEEDPQNISEGELRRRERWYSYITHKKALSITNLCGEVSGETLKPRSDMDAIAGAGAREWLRTYELAQRAAQRAGVHAWAPELPEEGASRYFQSQEIPEVDVLPNGNLLFDGEEVTLWESAPGTDLSAPVSLAPVFPDNITFLAETESDRKLEEKIAQYGSFGEIWRLVVLGKLPVDEHKAINKLIRQSQAEKREEVQVAIPPETEAEFKFSLADAVVIPAALSVFASFTVEPPSLR